MDTTYIPIPYCPKADINVQSLVNFPSPTKLQDLPRGLGTRHTTGRDTNQNPCLFHHQLSHLHFSSPQETIPSHKVFQIFLSLSSSCLVFVGPPCRTRERGHVAKKKLRDYHQTKALMPDSGHPESLCSTVIILFLFGNNRFKMFVS
jgi:hypothetical protein